MILNLQKLGNFIEEIEEKNTDLLYDVSDVRGISNTKEMMETKARAEYAELKKFYVVKPGEFAYNPRTSRNGEKIGIVLNNTNRSYIFTFNDICFRIKQSCRKELDSEYLFYLLKRETFDRYARYHSWGSATELFTWDDMKNVEIDLIPYDKQKEIVEDFKKIEKRVQLLKKRKEVLYRLCFATLDVFLKNPENFSETNASLADNSFCSVIKSGIGKFDGFKTYFATADVLEDYYCTDGETITKNERPSRANMKPKNNSVWFAKMKSTKKTLSFDKNDDIDWLILSTGFYGLITTDIYFYYLWAYINRPEFEIEKDKKCNGTTQEALNDDGLAMLSIPSPFPEKVVALNEMLIPVYNSIKAINGQLRQLEKMLLLCLRQLQ